MSKEQCVNKKLHPYYKTGIYGWIGEEVDDNDYIICPICGDVLGMNYWDYFAENNGDTKCPKCKQELDYSEIYDFEDSCYFVQLLEIKKQQISELEAEVKRVTNIKNYQTKKLIKKNAKLKEQLALTEKALELACEQCPFVSGACPNPPTHYDARDEYGSDEPYYIEEERCEGEPSDCLNCMINYFKTKAKENKNG